MFFNPENGLAGLDRPGSSKKAHNPHMAPDGSAHRRSGLQHAKTVSVLLRENSLEL
jgi:hypothetical protein